MDILLIAATEPELALVKQKANCNTQIINNKNLVVDYAVTGIGSTITAYKLTKLLSAKKYHLVINVGIAGGYQTLCDIGESCVIQSEVFADWGVHSPLGFQTMFNTALLNGNENPFTNGELLCPHVADYLFLKTVKHVKSLTVNATSGSEQQIQLMQRNFTADIENMEGGAVFYVCLMEQVPFVEIRSISNYIEVRDKSRWNIPLALHELSNTVELFLQSIS